MQRSHPGEGHALGELIKKAIADLELTTSEYEEIMAQAYSDGTIDSDEQRLLHELQELISNGTVKRVPG